jgi:hypothetical protein
MSLTKEKHFLDHRHQISMLGLYHGFYMKMAMSLLLEKAVSQLQRKCTEQTGLSVF